MHRRLTLAVALVLAFAALVTPTRANAQDGFVDFSEIQHAQDAQLMEGAGLPRSFRRLLRTAESPSTDSWHEGRGEYFAPVVVALAYLHGVGVAASPERAAHWANRAIHANTGGAGRVGSSIPTAVGRAELILAQLERDARKAEALLVRAAANGITVATIEYGDRLMQQGRTAEALAQYTAAAASKSPVAHWKLARHYLADTSAASQYTARKHLWEAAESTELPGAMIEAQLQLADLAAASPRAPSTTWGLTTADMGIVRERELIGRSGIAGRIAELYRVADSDPIAMTLHAVALRWGIGVKADAGKSYAQFRSAAMAGEPYAMVVMGEALAAEGDVRAVEWYRRAADRGSLRGEYLLRRWEQSPASSQEFLERAAGAGLAEAQVELAEALYAGRHGIKKNRARADSLLARAAAQGDPDDLLRVATRYLEGTAAPRDTARGMRYMVAAARAGSPDAAYRVAQAFETGRGLPRNLAQAAMWYEQSGYPLALARVAYWHESGALGRADLEKALALYNRVTILVDADSLGLEAAYRAGLVLEALGRVRQQGQFSSRPVARGKWEWAADRGHAPSALKAALLLDEDINTTLVRRDGKLVRVPKVEPVQLRGALHQKLFAQYAIAARGGEPWAEYRLAQILVESQRHASPDLYRHTDGEGRSYCSEQRARCDVGAYALLESAAARGLPAAQVELGEALHGGSWGRKAEPARARELIRKAALAGYPDGLFLHAQHFLWDENYREGEAWMRRAAASGHAEATTTVARWDVAIAKVRAERRAREAQLAAMRPARRPSGFWVSLVEVLAGIGAGIEAERAAAREAWSHYSNVGPVVPLEASGQDYSAAGAASVDGASSGDASGDASSGGASASGGASGGTSISSSSASSSASGSSASSGSSVSSGSSSTAGGANRPNTSSGVPGTPGYREKGYDENGRWFLLIKPVDEPYFAPVRTPVSPPRVSTPSTTNLPPRRVSKPCSTRSCVSPQ